MLSDNKVTYFFKINNSSTGFCVVANAVDTKNLMFRIINLYKYRNTKAIYLL